MLHREADKGTRFELGREVAALIPGATLIPLPGSSHLFYHGDWLARRGTYSSPPFTERGLYRRIRHPLMAGFLIVFWSAPTMTAGHLLFAAAATGYILMGIAFEEHDLIQSLGHTYDAYRARVPALIPRPRFRRRPPRLRRSAQSDWKDAT